MTPGPYRIAAFLLLTAALVSTTLAQTETSTVKSGYAPVNGLKMYYEIHGEGQPLVLIHGGIIGIATFGGNVDALAKGRQVIAVELQGHGRTADIDRPLTLDALSDDVVALVKYLHLDKVDVMGFSMGGEVALDLGVRHPEIIRKLVIVSAAYSLDGWYPEVREAFTKLGPQSGEMMKQSPFAKMYPGVNWATLFTKVGKMASSSYDFSAQVPALKMPVLLVYADADAVRPEHMVSFYQLLGGGKRDAGLDGSLRSQNQLAILPGVTHYGMAVDPRLPTTVASFLDAPGPAK
jgi:pimeloyl-ACP methyl ester carboxylesterase